MKRAICLLIACLMTFAFGSCGTDNDPTTENNGESITSAAQNTNTETGIDVDLTTLSSTMVYAELSNMLMAPDDYIGKTVKMRGQFDFYQVVDQNGQPIPNQIYFACIIQDATACCAQGLEFVLAGEHSFPDDYPEQGAEITVIGIFDVYEEDGYQYPQLTHAELEQ